MGGVLAVSTKPGAAAADCDEAPTRALAFTGVHTCQFLIGARTYGNNL